MECGLLLRNGRQASSNVRAHPARSSLPLSLTANPARAHTGPVQHARSPCPPQMGLSHHRHHALVIMSWEALFALHCLSSSCFRHFFLFACTRFGYVRAAGSQVGPGAPRRVIHHAPRGCPGRPLPRFAPHTRALGLFDLLWAGMAISWSPRYGRCWREYERCISSVW